MAFNFPEGAKFQFSTTFAGAKTITAATNADPAVLSSTAHGYSDGDVVLFTSGWEDATNSVFVVNQLTADTFEVTGLNSTNTTYFATGSGTGETQKITGWTDIPQVLTVATSGGDTRYTDVQLLAARQGIKIPTGFNPTTITLTLAHDPSNATYQSLLNLSRTFSLCAFRIVGGGGTTYGYGYISVNETARMQSGQVNQVECAISIIGRQIAYSS